MHRAAGNRLGGTETFVPPNTVDAAPQASAAAVFTTHRGAQPRGSTPAVSSSSGCAPSAVGHGATVWTRMSQELCEEPHESGCASQVKALALFGTIGETQRYGV
jgi:hypothetical protein